MLFESDEIDADRARQFFMTMLLFDPTFQKRCGAKAHFNQLADPERIGTTIMEIVEQSPLCCWIGETKLRQIADVSRTVPLPLWKRILIWLASKAKRVFICSWRGHNTIDGVAYKWCLRCRLIYPQKEKSDDDRDSNV